MYNQDLRREGFVNPERNYDDEPERDLAMAVCSLVFGVAGILTGIFGIGFDIAALVMGIVVLRRRYFGKGFAIAGIITSALGFAATITLTVLICIAGGELKDELISTITDYLYYYSDGGMFDDYEDDEDYFEDEEDLDGDLNTDDEDEYFDEEEYVDEDTGTDGSTDGEDDEWSDSEFADSEYGDSESIDMIDAADAFGDRSYDEIFSDEDASFDGEDIEETEDFEDTDTEE